MKPAISVILLTTLIGAAQGLFLTHYSAQLLALLQLLPASNSDEFIAGGAISLLLLALGLFASFFHLGHPERAWRAAAMWRTSWLSREVIALPATMALIFAYTALLYRSPAIPVLDLANGATLDLHLLIGLVAVPVTIALFLCTSMIYACLKFLRQWHSPLTFCNFLLQGCASGSTLAAAIGAYTNSPCNTYYLGCALTLTLFAGLSRWATLRRNKHLRAASNLQSATGINHPRIRQIAQGAMGGSFNTRAFIHTYPMLVVRYAKYLFLTAAFILPTILLLLWSVNPAMWLLPVIAFETQYAGLLIERWYFFIEAEHPQNAYYQMIS